MAFNYKKLEGLKGADNMGGTKTTIYYAPSSEFLLLKGTISPAVNPGDSVKIDGSHTFAVGKGFIPLYTTQDTGKLEAKATGERDGRGKMLELEFFHPGCSEDAAEFDRYAKNDEGIFLIPTPNGKVLQLGQADLYATITGDFNTGTLSSGRNGWTFKASAYSNSLLFYSGTITEKA